MSTEALGTASGVRKLAGREVMNLKYLTSKVAFKLGELSKIPHKGYNGEEGRKARRPI
jgi:hypothetical protein